MTSKQVRACDWAEQRRTMELATERGWRGVDDDGFVPSVPGTYRWGAAVQSAEVFLQVTGFVVR
jgi:hypothetical protein